MNSNCNSEDYIRRCILLAKKGAGCVSPNPMVGAVIVKNGRIVSEGWHHCFGGAHAEADAISKADPALLHDATIFVNLEPCSHQGKTPPCSLAIRNCGIKKVVYSVADPNPLTRGRSAAIFNTAGIEVETGILAKIALDLNRSFFTSIMLERPHVTLKLAQTIDGRIADFLGNSFWITGEGSRKLVHRERFRSDAVLVGINTVLSDNPRLNIRLHYKNKPLTRIVLDRTGRIPLEYKLVQSAGEAPLIIVGDRIDRNKALNLRKAGAEVLDLNPLQIGTMLAELYKSFRIGRLLVEGGSRVAGSFIREKLADELLIMTAPRLLGELGVNAIFTGQRIRITDSPQFILKKVRKSDSDIVARYYSRDLEAMLSALSGNLPN
ncbi:MAG: bifunctional diaminohydroxyphosphoribosylaminopyrimidine deaminase/5-amino-6-(5-phosphoribosylamino)uracil reductase RibD [Candidatus Wallbacteria bacterium]|nr:bifunctional diaminohydroxyphosphoribosylaminopyrimidine deaminase/5-amino-6-(5-phosphoribosylamino)uracil reductase RibD [Candidatus Wallbacteria bacterium]